MTFLSRGCLVVCTALLTTFTAAGAAAAELKEVTVDVAGKVYTVQSVVVVNAPIDAVYEVLADYDRFERVSSIFKDSRYLERDEIGNGLVFTRMQDCILFFCKTIDRTESIRVAPPTAIETEVIPDKSDLVSGRSRWGLVEQGDGTLVTYHMVMQPDFWIPPVIGPYFIRRFLRDGSADAAQRLENFALELVVERTAGAKN